MKELYQKIKFPLFICLFFGLLVLLWNLFNLPPEDQLIEITRGYFQKYGLITVFLAAIVEGTLLAGWYAPGGLVIFLGVILSTSISQTLGSVLCTILGFMIAYSFNFFVGKYGWYKAFKKLGVEKSLKKAEAIFQKYGFRAIYFSYWEPNLASLISTAAGTLQASFKKFFLASLVATLWWGAFWGTVTFIFGQKILNYLGIIFFGVMIGWMIWIIVSHKKQKKVTEIKTA